MLLKGPQRPFADWHTAAILYACISVALVLSVFVLNDALIVQNEAIVNGSHIERDCNRLLELINSATEKSRRFRSRGELAYLDAYRKVIEERHRVETDIEKSAGSQLAKVLPLLDELNTSEILSVKLAARVHNLEDKLTGRFQKAKLSDSDARLTGTAARLRSHALVYGEDYTNTRQAIRDRIHALRNAVNDRLDAQIAHAAHVVRRAFSLLASLSIIIPGLLLLEVLRRRRAELRLTKVVNLGQELSRQLSLEDAAKRILDTADGMIGWDAAMLDVYDSEADVIRNIVNYDVIDGVRREVTIDRPMPVSEMARIVLQHGAQLILRKKSGNTDTRTRPFGNESRPSASLIYVPIIHGETAIGILSIQSYGRNRFSRRDMELLQWLADRYAGAIDRAVLDENLRKSEERHRSLLDSSFDGVLVVRDESLVYCNSALATMFGYSVCEDICGQLSPLELAAPESRLEVRQILAQVQAGEPSQEPLIIICMRKDGSTFLCEMGVRAMDYEGLPAVLAIMRDVSERERASQEIHYLHQVYRSAIETQGAVPYLLSYKTQQYDFVGSGIFELTGFTFDELTSDKFDERVRDVHFHDDLKGLPTGQRARMMEAGELDHLVCDILFEKKDGHLIWLTDSSVTRRDADGKVIGSLGILADITGRKKMEIRANAFASLGEALSGATTPADAARVIANTADKLFGWDAALLTLYNLETDTMRGVYAQDTIDGKRVDVAPLLRNEKPTPRIHSIINGKPQLELRTPDGTVDMGAMSFGDHTRRSASLMYAAICNRGKPLGYLSFQSYNYFAYTEENLADLTALAEHCAAGLERAQLYEELHQNEEQFRTVWEQTGSGMRLTDADGIIRMVNPAFCKLVGMAREQLEGQPMDVYYARDMTEYVLSKYIRRFQAGTVPEVIERPLRLWNGKEIILEVANRFVNTRDGRMVLGVFRDRTSEKALEMQLRLKAEELERLAVTDSLTGLLNRREFMRRANIEVFRAERYSAPLSVLMLDLDHFKSVNDTHGHLVGDLVLTQFGEIIRDVLRVPDIAGRYGGEEFSICAPETDLEGAQALADRIRSRMSCEIFIGHSGKTFHVTCSIGIATMNPDSNDLTALLTLADRALYKAKEAGRNYVSS